METSLFPDYILDQTSNGDNGINDNDADDADYINHNKWNKDRNHYYDHNADDNITVMIMTMVIRQ